VVIWELGESSERGLHVSLPADGGDRPEPEIMASFAVKEMTFCGIDTVVSEDVLSFRESLT
jgi:hypothetical protein